MKDRLCIANALIAALAASAVAAQDGVAPKPLEPEPPISTAPLPGTPQSTPERNRALREVHLNALFRRLAEPGAPDWQALEMQINMIWSDSGSPAMNLLLSRARDAFEKSDYDTALLHLDDLVRLAPDFVSAWNMRATIYFFQEDYGRSMDDIAHTLALEPRHFGALAGLGLILDRLGNSAGAREVYTRALEINPHMPLVREGLKKVTGDLEGRAL